MESNEDGYYASLDAFCGAWNLFGVGDVGEFDLFNDSCLYAFNSLDFDSSNSLDTEELMYGLIISYVGESEMRANQINCSMCFVS